MKRIFVILAVGLFLAVAVSSAYAIEVFRTKTETIYWDPAKAYNGYTLFEDRAVLGAVLMDMEGNVVNNWPGVRNPKLLENGNLQAGSGLKGEQDWDGNWVWGPWTPPTYMSPHHDEWKIFNPKLNQETYIGLFYYTATNAEIWAAGGDPTIDYEAARRNTNLDGIYEIDMAGNVIWEWRFLDHTIQGRDQALPKYVGAGKTVADYPGKLDM